jgi:hypothetical protein
MESEMEWEKGYYIYLFKTGTTQYCTVKEWVCAKSKKDAIQAYASITCQDFNEVRDEYEIIRLKKSELSKHTIIDTEAEIGENEEYPELGTFLNFCNKWNCDEIICTTEY